MVNFDKSIIVIVCSAVCSVLTAQYRLNDPSIVAQHKRMVYEGWGDWRPNPKYILGIQTNFAYATVWGLYAPKQNRDYKNGDDIRPLKATGVQNQRMAEVKIEEKQAEIIKENVDSLNSRSYKDLAHWTSATVDADPLWLLYYKRMLKPLREFPEKPGNYKEWLLRDDATYQTLLATGAITKLSRDLELLKDKYHIARTVDMPRGKRFLMYQQILIDWRNLMYALQNYDKRSSLFLNYRGFLDKFRSKAKIAKAQTDKAIAESIMSKYKNKF